jgi:uncharacterized protein YpbB
MKAKLLIKTIAAGETISKEKLTTYEIKFYKVNKLERIQEDFKKVNITLIDDEQDIERYASKKSAKTKESKKSTVQETYELWKENNSIKEIAEIRKLTQQTISGHLAKLIEAKTIAISAILPEDKIQELAKAFEGYTEDSLNNLKEKYGNTFTWDELKLFKASMNAR